MLHLVVVDGGSKLLGFRRQFGVTVGELATLALWLRDTLGVAPPFHECARRVVRFV
jgi:hypothetical protein